MPHLQLTLAADPSVVPVDALVHFRLRLQSHADTLWLLPTPFEQGPGASFELHIRDRANGQEVAPPFLADAHAPPGPPHLTKLLPGSVIGAEIADPPQAFGMSRGHTYTVTALYHSPAQLRTRHQTPILCAGDGSFTSNTVQVTLDP